MPIRNTHRIGDYLMVDDDSGEVRYRSQLKKRWDGAWVQRKSWETRQPQEFVRPGTDPHPPSEVRSDGFTTQACSTIGIFIGATTVPVPSNGAAAHLFDPGVGSMEIGCTFYVR